ncbi:MAG TPA: hypothetical protein VD971_11450 [Phycisphaerales bacterium]|nr:hypothetical protein [Phycisphaerales bacterium]
MRHVWVMAVVALASPALGGEGPLDGPVKLRLRTEAGLWFVGVGGELQLPGGTGRVEMDELGFDSPNLAPAARVAVDIGDRWQASLRAAAVSQDETATMERAGTVGAVSFLPGDTVSSSFDLTQIELEGAYTVHRSPGRDRDGDGRVDFASKVDFIAGVRLMDIDWSVDGPGPASAADDTYLMPYIGGALTLRVFERFNIRVGADAGGLPLGDNTAFSGDVNVAASWDATPNIGLYVGYRSAFFDLSSGEGDREFAANGANQGLMIGASLRF